MAGSRDAALDQAHAIAREQTLEVPAAAAPADVEARLLGRVLDLSDAAAETWDAEIGYASGVFDGSLIQLLNVVFGNVSLMEGVSLVELELTDPMLATMPGPRFGIEGLRAMVGAADARPLVSVALKPLGLGPADLAELATTLVRAGVDVIKDDHGLANQRSAPYAERVPRVAEAVARANEADGRSSVYFPHASAPLEELPQRLGLAKSSGCRGVVLCPALLGLDTLRSTVAGGSDLAIMAHPSHASVSPGRSSGIAPDVLASLWRLAGADAVVYVNAHGRFPWSLDGCKAVNHQLRRPLGRHRPSFPVPAGGIDAEQVEHWFHEYGPDTLLLIGGSVLEKDDVEATARSVVEAAHAAGGRARG